MDIITRHRRSLAMATAIGAALLLAGCDDRNTGAKAFRPIPADVLALMSEKGTTKNSPVLLRAYKKEAELEVWKMKADGTYTLIKTYPMCRWSGQLGPKKREGDRQVPEGFYAITPGQMNPNSQYYLSFNIGYPNEFDRAHGRTGAHIMVHGACSSAGCFSMTDEQIAELYAISREAFAGGQRAIQMQSLPFRMNPENLAKHRLNPNMPFWKELKKGVDQFEVSRREPQVAVCGKRYVFNATPAGGARFNSVSACPPVVQDEAIVAAAEAKAREDERKVAELVAKGVKPIKLVYADGGQHPSFRHANHDVSRPEALAQGPTEIELDETGKPVKPALVQVAAAAAATPVLVAARVPATVANATVGGAVNAVANAPTNPAAPATATSIIASAPAAAPASQPMYSRLLGFVGLGKAEPAPAAAAVQQAAPEAVPAPPPAPRRRVSNTPPRAPAARPQAALRQNVTVAAMTGLRPASRDGSLSASGPVLTGAAKPVPAGFN